MRAAIIKNGRVWNVVEAESLQHPEFTLVAAPPHVQIGMTYNGSAFGPGYPPLGEFKSDKIDQINEMREQKETAGFTYLGSPLDSDEKAQRRIAIVSQAAQAAVAAAQPFPVVWQLADDTTRTFNANQVANMPTALAQHMNALHLHARSLRVAVRNASTPAEVAAVDITAGWPV